MDEEAELKTCPWPTEPIKGNEYLSRHISVNLLINDKESRRRFPSESNFVLGEKEDGLSHYWNKHISLEDIFITIGLTHNKVTGKFKNYTSFKVFQINNEFIVSLNEALSVVHSPAFYGDPSPVGSPNNRSHSLVRFPVLEPEDMLQIRINLADYCVNNYSDSYRDFDVKLIKEKVENLQSQGNNTRYHRIQDETV